MNTRRYVPFCVLLLAGLFLLPAAPVRAQESESANSTSWDVTEPRGDTREVDFTTREGTWMSVDVSPDGEWILFDLMGHIYRMPIEGGQAEVLTQNSGLAYNIHPRYSPDGEHIAFISDRKGQNNLWIMEADGSNPHPVFTDDYVQVSQPTWTPDGTYIVVKREGVSPNGGEEEGLWMYHRNGGEGMPLVSEEEVSGPTWPSISQDGRYLYFQAEVGGSGEPLGGSFQLRRYHFETGTVIDLTAGEGSQGAASSRLSSGGAFAPTISPGGQRLVFARKVSNGTISYKGHEFGPRTALWLRSLGTGTERKLMDPITSASETSRGILPRYAWMPGGGAIIIAQGGKIRRLNVNTGEVETIPFEARVRRTISEQAYEPFRITGDSFQPTFLRWHARSPDGSKLAFQAVGQVWVMDLPSGTPRRLTPDSYGRDQFGLAEFAPAWSPDGRFLAFTTLNAQNQGHVWKAPASGGEPQRLTERPAFYTNTAWSPGGQSLIVTRGGGATRRGRTVTHNAFFDLVRVPGEGGEAQTVAKIAPPTGTGLEYARRAIPGASFGPDGRIFFPDPTAPKGDSEEDDPITALVSVRPGGTDRRVHAMIPDASSVVPSPNGDRVAWEQGGNVYLAPLPDEWLPSGEWKGGEILHLEKENSTFPVEQLSHRGGLYPSWQDENTLEYGNANWHYTYNVSTGEKDSTRIRLTVPTGQAQGTIALTGARIITMNLDGQNVIEEGTVVVEDGRIRCVGAVGACNPSGADRVIDAQGKTITPGLIDMHAHHYRENRGHRPPNDYESAIYMAYGITTSLDNSMWSPNVFPTAERIKAGRLIGSRTFSTGDPLYQGDGPNQNRITSYEEAKDNVLRLKSWGAVSIKQYSNVRRDQRQWIVDAAREAGLMVTGHWRPGNVMDGHTGIEHALDYVPLYNDLTTFYGQAEAVYTPTMVVSGPGPESLEYWMAENNVWQQEKQQRWMPWRMRTFLRHRPLRPETDYSFPLVAQGMKEIIAAGGYGAIGGHGEHHALSPHWEIWMAAKAMGPMGALNAATMQGAHFLGAQQDLGSVEEGKLADLLVLNANPLDDIKNTLDIQYVMQGGTLYEGNTLDEVWPEQEPFGPRYWTNQEATVDDVRPVDYWKSANN